MIVKIYICTALLSFGSCSVKKFYPLAGSVVGGSAGSLGGPISAGLGAGAGWTVGKLAEGDAELKEAQETITALTTGDVDALLEKKLLDKKASGFFDSILDGVYDILKIGVIIIASWMIIQLWFSRHLHTKVKKNEESIS
jgi:hypothetical protein